MKKNLFLTLGLIFTVFFLTKTQAAILEVGTGKPYSSIQAAIDDAVSGDIIKVYPGNYIEVAANRTVVSTAGLNGPHQFGIFFDVSKPNITVQGVDASGNPITSYSLVAANVQLNATNNFGPSGMFVNADNITVTGLNLYEGLGYNKTVEVIGDNFTIKYCRFTDGMSLYLNDWSFDVGSNISHLQKYWIEGNSFEYGTSIDIASGAGFSGSVSDRKILNNRLDADGGYWAMISFNGSGSGVPWFVQSVGGAEITGNSFVNGEQYIRHRGIVDNSQFNWNQYWNLNTFDRSVITLSNEAGFIVRDYTYTSGSYTFTNVKRIGGLIQPEINNVAQASDVIKVGPGLYKEDVLINKSIKLKGSGYPNSTISGVIGGDNGTIRIGAMNVLIDGFSITREGNNLIDWNNPGLNSAGVAIQGQTVSAEVRNCSFFGNRTAIDINNSNGNNIHNNIINDNRTGVLLRNQTDNTNFQNNFVTNNWTVGVLFLDASGGTNVPVQSALNSFFNNNNISGNWYGQVVDRQSGGSLPAPGSNIKNFNCNWWGTINPVVSTANSSEPGYAALIPVTYGGTATPPGGQPDILGSASANIDYSPYLTNGNDYNATTLGFQPVPNSCNANQYVDCSNKKEKKVIVCHNGKSTCISLSALQTHLAHGDKLGPCQNVNRGEDYITDLNEEFNLTATPNPANSSTIIRYHLPIDGEVNITLHDPMGRMVSVLVNGAKKAGNHMYTLDVSKLAGGIYYYKMNVIAGAEKFTLDQKLMIFK